MKQIELALRHVDQLHPSPVDASDDEWEWLADVDDLDAIVVGGLRRNGISTLAVNGGLEQIRMIFDLHSNRLSADQRASLVALREVLQQA